MYCSFWSTGRCDERRVQGAALCIVARLCPVVAAAGVLRVAEHSSDGKRIEYADASPDLLAFLQQNPSGNGGHAVPPDQSGLGIDINGLDVFSLLRANLPAGCIERSERAVIRTACRAPCCCEVEQSDTPGCERFAWPRRFALLRTFLRIGVSM